MRCFGPMPRLPCLRSPSHEACSQGRAVLAAQEQQRCGLSVRWRPAYRPAPSNEPRLSTNEVARRPCASHTTSCPGAVQAPASPVPRASACLSGRRFAPRMRSTCTKLFSVPQPHRCSPLKKVRAEGKQGLTRMQMQVSNSGFQLRPPTAHLGIRLALVQACHQPANPSIERTSQGLRPCAASHVKR
jgi:hypothetical protein